MGSLLIYMVKSACCLAFFYLFYKLLLGKETFHRFNRFALLGVLVLSGILPFVQIARHDFIVDLFVLRYKNSFFQANCRGLLC